MDFTLGLITGMYAVIAVIVFYVVYVIEVKLGMPSTSHYRSTITTTTTTTHSLSTLTFPFISCVFIDIFNLYSFVLTTLCAYSCTH